MKILVVGDKAAERRIVVDVVTELGHSAAEAVDGDAGLRAYLKGDFDIVISDYIMPGRDGLELCRSIRSQPKNGAGYTYVLIASALSEKQHIMAGFEAGVDDYVSKPLDLDELRVRLISAVRVTEIHLDLAAKNAKLAELSESLMLESRRDPLTDVGNRLRFADDVGRLMDESSRYGHRFCLGMCDIDNFKGYNDTYGHVAGDDVLRKVAQTLASKIRASDQVYRMGGEEFLVILGSQDVASAAVAAERLRREVEALGIVHEGNQPYGKVTLTIGLTPFSATSMSELDANLQVADAFLYQGKAQGRNQVVIAAPEPSDTAAISAS